MDGIMAAGSGKGNDALAVLGSILDRAMAQRQAFSNTDTEIKRDGRQIVLPAIPAPMTYQQGIEVLARKQEEEEQEISFSEVVEAFPFDGAHALMKVLQAEYGWAEPAATPSFWGPKPPAFVDVQTGPKRTDRIKVIWGSFRLPGMDAKLSTGAKMDERLGYPQFVIHGTIKKKHLPAVEYVAELVRTYVAEHSIYRGKAITLTCNDDGEVKFDVPPSFHDTSKTNPDNLLFSEIVREQIRTNLLMPVQRTELCRSLKIPLKRGVCLAGIYGTGKTLTAEVLAHVAEKNGWTFILLPRVSALKSALSFARMYQPAIVFAEDIDRAIEGEDRTVEIDDILNTIDGVESKGTEIMTVLTTNHLDRINRAMLRPGRLDAVIEITPPDAATVEKLIQLYARGLLKHGADLAPVGRELSGQIPAVIREVVERAKLYAMTDLPDGEALKLTGEALLRSAQGMKAHLALLSPKVEPALSAGDRLAAALVELVGQRMAEAEATLDTLDARTDRMENALC